MKPIFRVLLFAGILCNAANAQTNYEGRQGGWWFSWGYNKEWYTHSDIHIKQASLGNDYVFKSVFAEDKPGWDKELFSSAFSIPQYNYRIGHWFKDNWGVEINFDHTKYQVAQMQALHVVGTMNGQHVDKYLLNDSVLVYQLNNGANFFLFNLVHRVQIPKLNYPNFNTSLLWKAGVGFMVPHVQNTIYGKDNNAGFQFGGLDAGFEAAMRFTFYKVIYLEYSNKVVYTNYWGLKVYEGTARQSFGTYEMILNLGVSLQLGHPERKKRP